jgi:hypothetical protein
MSFKFFVLAVALTGLAGCTSAPYSPDTGYTQAPPATTYYAAPTTYYVPVPAPGYVVVAPPASPASICTDTPAGC